MKGHGTIMTMRKSNASNTARRASSMTRLSDTLADSDWLRDLRARKGLSALPPRCTECGVSGRNTRTRDGYCLCGWGAIRRKDDARADEQIRAIRHENEEAMLSKRLPARHQSFTLDTHPLRGTAIHAIVRGWLAQWDGHRGLILRGDYGVGKTGFLVGLLKLMVPRVVAHGWSMRFTTSLDLFNDLQAGFKNETYQALLDMCASVHLLALDDLGAERITDWRQDQLLAILGARYNAKLPLMATTNCNATQLREYLTPRVYSRIVETCDVFEVVGDDLRLQVNR
jgi:DNA replication protein DnaC